MKTIQITFDDSVHREAKATASREGITLGEFVRRAVLALLAKESGPSEPSKTRADAKKGGGR